MIDENGNYYCDYCKKLFKPRKKDQRFCNNNGECRNAWHDENKKENGISAIIDNKSQDRSGEIRMVIVFSPVEADRIKDFLPGDKIKVIKNG